MQVNRFEMDRGRPTEARREPPSEDGPQPVRAAPARRADEDPHREETPEEPGYGHGV